MLVWGVGEEWYVAGERLIHSFFLETVLHFIAAAHSGTRNR